MGGGFGSNYWCPNGVPEIPLCSGAMGRCSCGPQITNTKFHYNVVKQMGGALTLASKVPATSPPCVLGPLMFWDSNANPDPTLRGMPL